MPATMVAPGVWGIIGVRCGMIDWDRVVELCSEIGEEGFGEVVDLFLDEVEGVGDAPWHRAQPGEVRG